jgi:hypothetical protein
LVPQKPEEHENGVGCSRSEQSLFHIGAHLSSSATWCDREIKSDAEIGTSIDTEAWIVLSINKQGETYTTALPEILDNFDQIDKGGVMCDLFYQFDISAEAPTECDTPKIFGILTKFRLFGAFRAYSGPA